MSFDIHLMAFQNGNPAAANRDAARAFLDTIEHKVEPEFNAYSLTLHDGANVEIYAAGLHGDAEAFQGAMIALRGFSDSICDFIYNFCIASSCIAIPAMEASCVLVPEESMTRDLPDGFTDDFAVILIQSGSDVGIALEGGYDAWAAIRDRILRDARRSEMTKKCTRVAKPGVFDNGKSLVVTG